MMRTLVLAEFDGSALKPAALSTIAAAQQLGQSVDVVLLGSGAEAAAGMAKQIPGVDTVLVANSECNTAEQVCAALYELREQYSCFMASSSTYGKNILPRLAAKLDIMQLSDVVEIQGPSTFVRPIYAGNIMATYECQQPTKVITIRPTAFAAVATSGGDAAVKEIDMPPANIAVQFVKLDAPESTRPELTDADVVVSGGRALQSQENFYLIEQLADTLNAAVGATRAAVDAGYVPNDYQVGQTGKVVAPKLYIAVGISGAIQHLAGMKDSQVIVAINKDPDAPIFQVSDYGLVGDLFEIVPELTRQLQQRKAA